MKLRTQIFIVSNKDNHPMDMEGRPIMVLNNGNKTDVMFSDICSDSEFDDGEIYGNTLLSYYQVQPDGSLKVEGSTITLKETKTNEPVLVKQIIRPSVNDDTEISLENIQKFVDYFGILNPEEVFTGLTAAEKEHFASQQSSRKEKELANAEQEKQKTDVELKASIDPVYIQEAKDYRATQAYYSGVNYKEYTNGNYHLFYGADKAQQKCVLIKRGNWWEESSSLSILEETDQMVKIEFLDGETTRIMELDIPQSILKIS